MIERIGRWGGEVKWEALRLAAHLVLPDPVSQGDAPTLSHLFLEGGKWTLAKAPRARTK
jgi:hypothetical protein